MAGTLPFTGDLTRAPGPATPGGERRRVARTPRPGAELATWGWWAVVALLLCGAWLVQVRPVEQLVVLLVFLLLCAAGIGHSVFGTFRPVLCLYSVFNLCWLVVPATYQLSHRRAAWDDDGVFDDPHRTFTALVMLTLGMAAVLVGYLTRRQPARTTPAPERVTDLHRVRRWSVLMLVASLLLLPLVLRSSGGFASLFATRYALDAASSANGFDITEVGGGLFALVRIVPGVVALVSLLLALWAVRVSRAQGVRAPAGSLVLLAAAFAMTVLYLNPLTSSRYNFTTAVAAVVLTLWHPTTAARGRLVAVAALAGLLLVYPLANVFRYGSDGPGANVVQTGLSALYSPDFDGTQQAVNSVGFVEANGGHTDGLQVLSAALIAVPRSIWPQKAVPTNVRVAENRGYAFTNLSIPAPAELWVDLGIPGMLLLLLLWGRFAHALDLRWRRAGPSLPFVAFVCVAQIGLVRGPLSAAAGFAGLGSLVLWWALRAREPRQEGGVRP